MSLIINIVIWATRQSPMVLVVGWFVWLVFWLMVFLLHLDDLMFSRFFTMVPHDFGRNNARLLNNVEIIKEKTAMLDNLLEIEIAYGLLQSGELNFERLIYYLYLKRTSHRIHNKIEGCVVIIYVYREIKT